MVVNIKERHGVRASCYDVRSKPSCGTDFRTLWDGDPVTSAKALFGHFSFLRSFRWCAGSG